MITIKLKINENMDINNEDMNKEMETNLFPFGYSFISINESPKREGRIDQINIKKDGSVYYIDDSFEQPLIISHNDLIKQTTKYPKFYENKKTHEILRADSEKDQYLVFSNLSIFSILKNPIDLKNDTNWKLIPYNEDRKLYHNQPVFFYSHGDSFFGLGFYDVIEDNILHTKNMPNIYPDEINALDYDQLQANPFLWDLYLLLKKEKVLF